MFVVSEQIVYLYFVNVCFNSQDMYLMTLLIDCFVKKIELGDSCSSGALFNVYLILNTRNCTYWANRSDVIAFIDCIPWFHEYTSCQINCLLYRNKVNICLYFVQNMYFMTLLIDCLDEKV